MNKRKHSCLVSSLVATIASSLLALQPVHADIVGPYAGDANTLHLWHLDEADPGPATSVGNGTLFSLTPGNGAFLGATAFAGFGTAADTTAGTNAGLQGSAIPVSDLTGADGAFTFEAIIRTSEFVAGQQIIAMDADGANSGRPFQFRIDNDQLRFINIGGSAVEQILAALPTTGPDVPVANEWFHAAVTYNGNENTADNIKLYWTRVDPARTEANEILSTQMVEDLTGSATFGAANEYRGTADQNMKGQIDEVRISDIARAADEMLFGIAGPDLDPPLLASTSPVDDPPAGVAVSVTLTATFNEDIQAGTGNITIRNLTDVTDTVIAVTDGSQVTISGTTLTIDPATDLAAPKGYAVLIDATAIEDLANNAFAGIADDTAWNFSTDGAPPGIVSRSPADDAIEVLVGTNLNLAFDEPITAGTGNITIRRSSDDSVVEAFDVTSSSQLTFGTSSITIDPTADLPADIGLYVEIDATAIEDAAENAFAGISDKTAWNFATAASQSTVVLFADDFSDGSLGTPVDPNDPGGSISGTLAESSLGDPYLQLNVGGGTLGGEAGGEASWSNLNAPTPGSGVITLNCDLATNSTVAAAGQFTVQVLGLNPVDDGDGTSGNWVAVNLFQAAPPTNGGNTAVTQATTGLGVLFRDNGLLTVWSAGVAVGTATFDAAPANGSYDVAIEITNLSGFGPGNSFDYQVLVGGVPVVGIGGALSGLDTSGNFISLETRSSPSRLGEFRLETIASDNDLIVPTLKGVSPADDAPSVLPGTNLVAVFDEPMVVGTGNVEIRRVIDNSLLESFDITTSGQLTLSGGRLTIDPTSNLPDGGVYVLIDATALDDAAGNSFSGISDSAAWNFVIDGTAPTSSGMTPIADATDVWPLDDLGLSFGEDVVAGTGNITIYLASDDSVVETIDVTSGAVTITGSDVTINPAGDFGYGTAYYVQIDGGAFTDLAGNPFTGISDTTSWAFTTSPIPSGLIFFDDFDGGAGDLDTTTPDTTVGGAAWVSSPTFKADGSTEDGAGSATLAFTPFEGFVYVLDASYSGLGLAGTAGSPENDWFGVGFGNGQSTGSTTIDRFITGDVVGSAWMLTRGETSQDPNTIAWLGTGQLGGGNGGLAGGNVGIMVPAVAELDLRIVLDTTGGPAVTDWTTTWLAKVPSDSSYSTVRPTENLLAGTVISSVGLARSNPGVTGTVESFSLSTIDDAPLVLKISESAGLLEFEWNSLSGMQYDLVSPTDPEAEPDPSLWAPYNDGVTTYENISNSGTGTNVLTGVERVGTVRLFALIEEPIPPLFSEDFEGGFGGFTVTDHSAGETGTDWAQGDPISGSAGAPNVGGFVDSGNGGSTNCVGTNIGDPGFHTADTDTCLRSGIIDLTGVAAATLSFAEALDVEGSDTAVVNIIDDTTDTIISAAIYTATDGDSSSAIWNTVAPIAIPAPALGQLVRIEWRFTGVGGGTTDYMGWYIDDVMITAE